MDLFCTHKSDCRRKKWNPWNLGQKLNSVTIWWKASEKQTEIKRLSSVFSDRKRKQNLWQ